MYLNKASKQQEKKTKHKKNKPHLKTASQWPPTKTTADQRQPDTFLIKSLNVSRPPSPFPKDTTPSGVKGEPGWEGALSISIAIETTQGMTLLCDSVDTECCYQDIQWNKTKVSHIHTGEKKILKGTIY